MNTFVLATAQTAAAKVARVFRFLRHVITLRSISSAVFVDQLENFTPPHQK